MTGTGRTSARAPSAKIIARGASVQVAGILILSVLLFEQTPLFVAICLPFGTLLVLLGFVAWIWGAARGRE